MALCNFGQFYLVSKISQKLLELEPWHLMNRLVVMRVDNLINFWRNFEIYFLSYAPLLFWAFLSCQQNISKTIRARDLKLGELIGNDE